jgi:hypothetical protein
MRPASLTCGRCPAVLRGKKILVVGDDKQVSPDGGFIAAARIAELQGPLPRGPALRARRHHA